MKSQWEPVIGLEIHIQLNTKTKLFSPALNHFGAEPNINISSICTGQPGALPLLNKEAVNKAILFGLAIGGKISKNSTFDRKSYFYPDSPRNFQITQYENPIIQGGSISAYEGDTLHTFSIARAHLEDDTGMLKHFSSFSGVDYNRAGAPLIEVVSKPCIHSAKEAYLYASEMRKIAVYLGISDGNMEEGNMRIDANISVRKKKEQTLRPHVEIKNLNSFNFLELAIASEIERQIALYTSHPRKSHLSLIPPETYRWDQETGKTVLMRKKESAEDYRYFPEPDLGPILLTQEYIDHLKRALPELPNTRFRRYTTDLGLSPHAATVLINDKGISDYFEKALETCPYARSLCNWITVEFSGRLKTENTNLLETKIPPKHIARLVTLLEQNKITGPIAKCIAGDMILNPSLSPEEFIAQNPDYVPIDDLALLEPIIDHVLKNNEQSIVDYKAGKQRAFGFLIGQVMKETQGKASPRAATDLLRKKIALLL